jgi:hypothetical protein
MSRVIESIRPLKRLALHSSWYEPAINLQNLQVGLNRNKRIVGAAGIEPAIPR